MFVGGARFNNAKKNSGFLPLTGVAREDAASDEGAAGTEVDGRGNSFKNCNQ
jgi:hypothetical protein